MKGNQFFVLSIVVLSSVAVGCIGQATQELEGTLWKLDSYVNSDGNVVSVLPNTKITAQFQGGTVGGSAGCNTYSGDYTINGNAITIGPLSSTRMYCTVPVGIMEQEYDYLTALESATGYEIEGNTMEMTNADGDVILIFAAPELEGTLWKLDSYVNSDGNVVSVLPNTEITAQFQGGTVGGSAGCNAYGGSYTISGNAITISSIFTTEMYCHEPVGIMEQEYDYLTALGSAAGYEIEGSTMEMTNADGDVILIFTAA
ncbi:MAG: META domain-containing protein [Theionarchaea archaeon]|nr:MAG: hypothetical protein AYK19_01250 [Theionarchaea archaeon DG-70-1]MBU7025510.1 META domain-containing protein [Theionarchaea archaeon]